VRAAQTVWQATENTGEYEDLLADLDHGRVVGGVLGVDHLGDLDAGGLVSIRVGDTLGNLVTIDAGGDIEGGEVGLVHKVVLELHLRLETVTSPRPGEPQHRATQIARRSNGDTAPHVSARARAR
jgi:hypothetical protein